MGVSRAQGRLLGRLKHGGTLVRAKLSDTYVLKLRDGGCSGTANITAKTCFKNGWVAVVEKLTECTDRLELTPQGEDAFASMKRTRPKRRL